MISIVRLLSKLTISCDPGYLMVQSAPLVLGHINIYIYKLVDDTFSTPFLVPANWNSGGSITGHVNQPTCLTLWTALRFIFLWYYSVDHILRCHMHANVSSVPSGVCYRDRTKRMLTTGPGSSIMSSKVHVFCTHSLVYPFLF